MKNLIVHDLNATEVDYIRKLDSICKYETNISYVLKTILNVWFWMKRGWGEFNFWYYFKVDDHQISYVIVIYLFNLSQHFLFSLLGIKHVVKVHRFHSKFFFFSFRVETKSNKLNMQIWTNLL